MILCRHRIRSGMAKEYRTLFMLARTNETSEFEQQQIEQAYQAAQKEMHSLKADEQILRNKYRGGEKADSFDARRQWRYNAGGRTDKKRTGGIVA